jgi:hypothetical protein
MDIDEVAHSMSEVDARAVIRHLDIPPAPLQIEIKERLAVPLRLYS